MKKRFLNEHIDLDDLSYIENGIIKYKLNEEQINQKYLTWEEGWERVKMILNKIRENENNRINTDMG